MKYHIPNGCQFGITGSIIGLPNRTLTTAYISQPHETLNSSADTWLYGSFCPRLSGTYNLYFEGKYNDIYYPYSIFNGVRGSMNISLTGLQLNKGQCYSITLRSPDLYSTWTRFSVECDGQPRYIPSRPELLTCPFDGCLNGNSLKNQCRPKTNECSFFHYHLSLLTFISLFLYYI